MNGANDQERGYPAEIEVRGEVTPASPDAGPPAVQAEIESLFPPPRQAPAGPVPVAAEWKRYVFPLALVGCVIVVMALFYAAREKPASLKDVSAKPTQELTAEDRLVEAEKLVADGHRLWDEGYGPVPDDTIKLREAMARYREAWRLVTGEAWATEDSARNDRAGIIHDSPRATVLKQNIRDRIETLEDSLDGWPLW